MYDDDGLTDVFYDLMSKLNSTEFNTYECRMAAVRLADTLHNIGILNDTAFDTLLIEIYSKY